MPVAKMGRPPVENPKDKKVTMRASAEDYERIIAYAKAHDMTMAQLVKKSLEKYMTENP